MTSWSLNTYCAHCWAKTPTREEWGAHTASEHPEVWRKLRKPIRWAA